MPTITCAGCGGAREAKAAPGRKFPWYCPCISCGEPAVVMGLWEPDAERWTFHCNGCDADFYEEDVRALVSGWAAFLVATEAARATCEQPRVGPSAH